jgi:hypothetical protein
MLCTHTKCHVPSWNGSLVFAIKPWAKCNFHAVAILFSYIKEMKRKLHLLYKDLLPYTITGSYVKCHSQLTSIIYLL